MLAVACVRRLLSETQPQLLGPVRRSQALAAGVNADTDTLLAAIVVAGVLAVAAWGWWYIDVTLPRRRKAFAQAPTLKVRKFIPKNKPVLVIAGTYREYELFCAQHKINRYHDAVYVRTYREVVGKRRSQFAYTGTWHERLSVLELNAIQAQLEAEQCREYPQYHIYP